MDILPEYTENDISQSVVWKALYTVVWCTFSLNTPNTISHMSVVFKAPYTSVSLICTGTFSEYAELNISQSMVWNALDPVFYHILHRLCVLFEYAELGICLAGRLDGSVLPCVSAAAVQNKLDPLLRHLSSKLSLIIQFCPQTVLLYCTCIDV